MISESKFLKVKFEDLTAFHQQKIMDRARAWRSAHNLEVQKLIKVGRSTEALPPLGSNIFDPAKWGGANWIWFCSEMMKKAYQ